MSVPRTIQSPSLGTLTPTGALDARGRTIYSDSKGSLLTQDSGGHLITGHAATGDTAAGQTQAQKNSRTLPGTQTAQSTYQPTPQNQTNMTDAQQIADPNTPPAKRFAMELAQGLNTNRAMYTPLMANAVTGQQAISNRTDQSQINPIPANFSGVTGGDPLSPGAIAAYYGGQHDVNSAIGQQYQQGMNMLAASNDQLLKTEPLYAKQVADNNQFEVNRPPSDVVKNAQDSVNSGQVQWDALPDNLKPYVTASTNHPSTSALTNKQLIQAINGDTPLSPTDRATLINDFAQLDSTYNADPAAAIQRATDKVNALIKPKSNSSSNTSSNENNTGTSGLPINVEGGSTEGAYSFLHNTNYGTEQGQDIIGKVGARITATTDLKITAVGAAANAGWSITAEDINNPGTQWQFLEVSPTTLKPGTIIKSGQQIGTIGPVVGGKYSNAPNVEVRKIVNGKLVDPMAGYQDQSVPANSVDRPANAPDISNLTPPIQKAISSLPVALQKYVSVQPNGTAYINTDPSKMTPALAAAIKIQAAGKIPLLSQDQVDGLQAMDGSGQQLQNLAGVVNEHLTPGLLGRAKGLLINPAISFSQMDPAFTTAFNTARLTAIGSIKSLIGGAGSGVRITQSEADSMTNALPTTQDNQESAIKKLQGVQQLMDQKQLELLPGQKTLSQIYPIDSNTKSNTQNNNSVPAVGGTFNGEKVLKVEKVG